MVRSKSLAKDFGWLMLVLIFTGLIVPKGIAQSSLVQEITARVDREYENLFQLYRHLHANPELSFQEAETAERIRKELELASYQVTAGIGGFGLAGVLKNGEGPTLMIRTDLDGLPVTEQTGLEYASRIKIHNEQGNEVGVMQACGHDIHMTSFVGTARLMSQLRDYWRGTLVMIGQPAEERGGGAPRPCLPTDCFKNSPGLIMSWRCMMMQISKPGRWALSKAMPWRESIRWI